MGVLFNERVLKVDDPCGAISVHGFCGTLGGICLGIFADGTYGAGWNGSHLFKLADGSLKYFTNLADAPKDAVEQGVTGLLGGNASQFVCQLLGAGINIVWAFGVTFIVFKIVNSVKSMRVAPEIETEGLDVPEFGGLAYPEDAVIATPTS